MTHSTKARTFRGPRRLEIWVVILISLRSYGTKRDDPDQQALADFALHDWAHPGLWPNDLPRFGPAFQTTDLATKTEQPESEAYAPLRRIFVHRAIAIVIARA
jgi:hypothetical protein